MTIDFKKKIKKTGTVVCTVLIILLLVAVGYLTYCNMSGKVAFIGNHALMRIISPSMEPEIPTGSYILTERISKSDIQDIKVGDVIVFYSKDPAIYGNLNTHRVVEIVKGDNGTEFITKGDNNAVKDSLRTVSGDVVGRYVKKMPAISKVASVFTNKTAFFLLILIPSFILVIICVMDVKRKSKEVKMELLVAERVKQLRESEMDQNNLED